MRFSAFCAVRGKAWRLAEKVECLSLVVEVERMALEAFAVLRGSGYAGEVIVD
jgi:hypothetical protein